MASRSPVRLVVSGRRRRTPGPNADTSNAAAKAVRGAPQSRYASPGAQSVEEVVRVVTLPGPGREVMLDRVDLRGRRLRMGASIPVSVKQVTPPHLPRLGQQGGTSPLGLASRVVWRPIPPSSSARRPVAHHSIRPAERVRRPCCGRRAPPPRHARCATPEWVLHPCGWRSGRDAARVLPA